LNGTPHDRAHSNLSHGDAAADIDVVSEIVDGFVVAVNDEAD
jgi:hypothetical protein